MVLSIKTRLEMGFGLVGLHVSAYIWAVAAAGLAGANLAPGNPYSFLVTSQ